MLRSMVHRAQEMSGPPGPQTARGCGRWQIDRQLLPQSEARSFQNAPSTTDVLELQSRVEVLPAQKRASAGQMAASALSMRHHPDRGGPVRRRDRAPTKLRCRRREGAPVERGNESIPIRAPAEAATRKTASQRQAETRPTQNHA